VPRHGRPNKSIVYLAYGAARPAPQNVKLHPKLTPVLMSGTALRTWDEWLKQDAARMGMYFHHDDDFMFVLPKLDMHEIARKLRYAAASGRARVFYIEAHPIWPLLEKLVKDPGFEEIGQALGPDELAIEREIVLNPEQLRQLGMHFWFADRADYRVVVADLESHCGRFSLMIENCLRTRLTRTVSAETGERIRVGLWLKHNGGRVRHYTMAVDAMGPGLEGVMPLASLRSSQPADAWHELQTDVVVPPGASRVNLRVFVDTQGVGSRCWIDDLFIGKHPPTEAGAKS